MHRTSNRRLNYLLLAALAVAILGGLAVTADHTDGTPSVHAQAPGSTTPPLNFCDIVGFATIVGTEGDDWIEGTDSPDVIFGLGGNDTIHGMGGNDTICGGAGDDYLHGGHGMHCPAWSTLCHLPTDGVDILNGGSGPFLTWRGVRVDVGWDACHRGEKREDSLRSCEVSTSYPEPEPPPPPPSPTPRPLSR